MILALKFCHFVPTVSLLKQLLCSLVQKGVVPSKKRPVYVKMCNKVWKQMVFKGLIPSKSICSLNLQINKFSKLCIFWEKVCLWLYEKFVPGMMRMGLLKSSPNFQRLDMAIPVLLFLSIRWGQKKGTSKKTCEGICCGWRTWGLTHKFLRAHAPAWGFVVDSGGLSSWDSIPSARLCRGRQHEGDWRKTWASWWQHWGEESESYVFSFTLFSFSAFLSLKN